MSTLLAYLRITIYRGIDERVQLAQARKRDITEDAADADFLSVQHSELSVCCVCFAFGALDQVKGGIGLEAKRLEHLGARRQSSGVGVGHEASRRHGRPAA